MTPLMYADSEFVSIKVLRKNDRENSSKQYCRC